MRISKEGFLVGQSTQCAEETCTFRVMFTQAGWYHVDTHGKDVSDHEALPKGKDEASK